MTTGRGQYYKRLAKGTLPLAGLKALEDFARDRVSLQPIDRQLLSTGPSHKALPSQLTHLSLHLARGSRSWNGLVVGFPGNRDDLSTNHVGTPFLRMVLYPILALHGMASEHYGVDLPCLYLLGDRFSDVFLRKFRFLAQAVDHVLILTRDIVPLDSAVPAASIADKNRESYVQNILCERMAQGGLSLPTRMGSVTLSFLATELPTCEGTRNPERLDILAVNRNDGALVAFELKGPKASQLEIENLFFQGLEHRDWLEQNKMAIKFIVEGPRGRRINTRKRVMLVLGLCADHIPPLFLEFRRRATAKDPYLDIRFVRLVVEPSGLVCVGDVR